jgi:hypothetical protein
VHRIELQQVRRSGTVTGNFVNLVELQVRAVPASTQRKPAHATEAIDSN